MPRGRPRTKSLRSKEEQKPLDMMYQCWSNMRKRCYKKTARDYKNYGAKGIKIEFSLEDFKKWYLKNLLSKNWIKPSIGRVDHSKNYSLCNIEMIEFKENCSENAKRNNFKMRGKFKGEKVYVYCRKTGKFLYELPSIKAAADHFGVSHRLVGFYIHGKYKYPKPGNDFGFLLRGFHEENISINNDRKKRDSQSS